MQTLELREASQPLALVTKMERSDVKYRPPMGPLKLFESSNHTFATWTFKSMRSILGGSVRQRRIFGNTVKSASEDRIEQSLEGIPLRLDVRIVREVGNEV